MKILVPILILSLTTGALMAQERHVNFPAQEINMNYLFQPEFSNEICRNQNKLTREGNIDFLVARATQNPGTSSSEDDVNVNRNSSYDHLSFNNNIHPSDPVWDIENDPDFEYRSDPFEEFYNIPDRIRTTKGEYILTIKNYIIPSNLIKK